MNGAEKCHERVTFRVRHIPVDARLSYSFKLRPPRPLRFTSQHNSLFTPDVEQNSSEHSSSTWRHVDYLCPGRRVRETNSTALTASDGLFSHIYTGGTDSLARVWKADAGTDQEPEAALEAMEAITCVAAGVRNVYC